MRQYNIITCVSPTENICRCIFELWFIRILDRHEIKIHIYDFEANQRQKYYRKERQKSRKIAL